MFTFLLKIYPKSASIYSVIYKKYGHSGLLKFRKLEKTFKRKEKALLDLEFLTKCYDNFLYPKFLNFKISVKRLQNSAICRQFQRRILLNEIRYKRSTIRKLETSCQQLLEDVKHTASWLVFFRINKHISKCINNVKSKFNNIHSKKLIDLGYNPVKHPPSNDVIFNFSDRILTDVEKEALLVGLNFCITPRKFNLVNHFLPFEKLFFQLKNITFYNKTNERGHQFMSDLKHIAH